MGWNMAVALFGAFVTAYFIVGALQWWRRRDARPLPHWSWRGHSFDGDQRSGEDVDLSFRAIREELFATCEPDEDVKRVFAADGKQVSSFLSFLNKITLVPQSKVQGWVPHHISELE
ncbi:hypothetical protein QOT17_020511 [Balamuthia mandrillaris]